MSNATLGQYPSGSSQYKVEFDYLARSFVVVTLVSSTSPSTNKVLTQGIDYRFLNATTLEILTSQSGFDIVQIHRFTDSDLLVAFRDGSVLTSQDLTVAELQAIHIAEEGRDQTAILSKQYADQASAASAVAVDSMNKINAALSSGLYGYVLLSSFQSGETLSLINHALLDTSSGEYYRWDGGLPKVVPPGSTPLTSGGVGPGKWLSIGYASLRQDLSSPNPGLGDSLMAVKLSAEGAVARSQHSKNEDFITSRDFGADSSGLTDAAPQLNALLRGGNKSVFIPGGTYLVRSYLRLYSNTRLVMAPDCIILNDNISGENVFLNGEYGNASYATGYDGESNIIIEGGVIDSSLKAARREPANSIGIAHAHNILISNVTFRNSFKSHFVEINSSRDVLIENCKFSNLDAGDAPGNRSMINIDYAFAEGFPPFGSYDGTVCRNVVMNNCTFIDGDSAVDSHSSPSGAESHHSGIKVTNSYISNMRTSGISPRFWKDSLIDNCTLVNSGSRTIRAWSSVRLIVSNSSFIGGGSQYSYSMAVDDVSKPPSSNVVRGCTFDGVSGACIIMTGGDGLIVDSCTARGCGGNLVSQAAASTNLVVSDCISLGSTGTGSPFQVAGTNVVLSGLVAQGAYEFAVNLQGSNSGVVVEGCYLTKGTVGTIRITSLCRIDGRWHVSLPTNGVVSIPIGDSTGQGIVTISSNWLQEGSTINGCYQVRGGQGTELVQAFYSLSPAPSLLTGVLTGSTGPSGAVSLSAAADGKMYLENRTGSQRFFVIEMVAF